IRPTSGHGHQPCRYGFNLLHIRKLLIQLEPHLLENVRNILRVGAKRPCDRVDEALVSLDQILPGVLVAFETTLDQFAINTDRHPHPVERYYGKTRSAMTVVN